MRAWPPPRSPRLTARSREALTAIAGRRWFALLLGILLLAWPAEPPAHAATFVVVNQAGNGAGSLLQAITDANSQPGLDRIEFRIPVSAVLRTNDFPSSRAFAQRLIEHPDPVSALLWSSLTEERQGTLTRFVDSADVLPRVMDSIMPMLNTVLQGPSIYSSERFAGVTLSAETDALRLSDPQGVDLVRLNRWLIVDALPGLVVRNNPDGLAVNILAAVLTATEPVDIDGTTQAGYTDFPVVGFYSSGSLTPQFAKGLILTGGSSIRGVAFYGFRANGQGRALTLRGTGNVVTACAFGARPNGATASTEENGIGLALEQSSGNRIGGSSAADRNYFLVNNQGLLIEGPGAENNLVIGNYFGGYPTGDTWREAAGSTALFVQDAPNTTIGGLGAGEGNFFFTYFGSIEVTGNGSTGFKILGNYAGLRPNGTLPLSRPTAGGGVTIRGGSEGLIRGNAMTSFTLGGSNHVVYGNTFNADPSGLRRLPLDSRGLVSIQAPGSIIGGAGPGEPNLFAGDGQRLASVSGARIVFANNRLGTDWSGSPLTNVLANGNGPALSFDGAGAVAYANLIAGNSGVGVFATGSGTTFRDNVIRNNKGAGAQLSQGVLFTNNLVVDNGGAGVVQITGANITANRITGPGLAIDRIGDGPTPNVNFNANNYASVTNANIVLQGDQWEITGSGSYAAARSDNRSLEIFVSDRQGPGNRGDLLWYLGRTQVSTDATGNGTFSFVFNSAAAVAAPSGARLSFASRRSVHFLDGDTLLNFLKRAAAASSELHVSAVVLPRTSGTVGKDTGEPGPGAGTKVQSGPSEPKDADVGIFVKDVQTKRVVDLLNNGFYHDITYTLVVSNRTGGVAAHHLRLQLQATMQMRGIALTFSSQSPAEPGIVLDTNRSDPANLVATLAQLNPGEAVEFQVQATQHVANIGDFDAQDPLDAFFPVGLRSLTGLPPASLTGWLSADEDKDLQPPAGFADISRLPNYFYHQPVVAPPPEPIPSLRIGRDSVPPIDPGLQLTTLQLPDEIKPYVLTADELKKLNEGFEYLRSLNNQGPTTVPDSGPRQFFVPAWGYETSVEPFVSFSVDDNGNSVRGPDGVELNLGPQNRDIQKLNLKVNNQEYTLPPPATDRPYRFYFPPGESPFGDTAPLSDNTVSISLSAKTVDGAPPFVPLNQLSKLYVLTVTKLENGLATSTKITVPKQPASDNPYKSAAEVVEWVTVSDKFPDLEEAKNGCAIGAGLNGLRYLDREFFLGSILPEDETTTDGLRNLLGQYIQALHYNPGFGVKSDEHLALKQEHARKFNIPVTVRSTSDPAEAYRAIKDGCAVEVVIRAVADDPSDPDKWVTGPGHVASVVRMTRFNDGTIGIHLSHDTRQGQAGGIAETVHWIKPPSRVFGSPGPAPTAANGQKIGCIIEEFFITCRD